METEITSTKQESAQMVSKLYVFVLLASEDNKSAHTHKQKTKYERKLQRMRTSSAMSRAETALAVFELKDENSKLLEENSRLLGERKGP